MPELAGVGPGPAGMSVETQLASRGRVRRQQRRRCIGRLSLRKLKNQTAVKNILIISIINIKIRKLVLPNLEILDEFSKYFLFPVPVRNRS